MYGELFIASNKSISGERQTRDTFLRRAEKRKRRAKHPAARKPCLPDTDLLLPGRREALSLSLSCRSTSRFSRAGNRAESSGSNRLGVVLRRLAESNRVAAVKLIPASRNRRTARTEMTFFFPPTPATKVQAFDIAVRGRERKLCRNWSRNIRSIVLLREATTPGGVGWKVRARPSFSDSRSWRGGERALTHTDARSYTDAEIQMERDIPSGGASDRQMNRLIELVDEPALRRAL